MNCGAVIDEMRAWLWVGAALRARILRATNKRAKLRMTTN